MKLLDYLREKGLTQQQFGDLIGRSQQAVARYCAARVPDSDTMKLILAASGGAVTPNDFYDLPVGIGSDPGAERQVEQGQGAAA